MKKPNEFNQAIEDRIMGFPDGHRFNLGSFNDNTIMWFHSNPRSTVYRLIKRGDVKKTAYKGIYERTHSKEVR